MRDMAQKVSIKPLGDQVLLKTVEPENKTAAGIYIPATAQDDTPIVAEVLAVGESDKIKKKGIKVGDVVIYSKYAGTEVEYKGEKYILVSVKDILAKVVE